MTLIITNKRSFYLLHVSIENRENMHMYRYFFYFCYVKFIQ